MVRFDIIAACPFYSASEVTCFYETQSIKN